MFFRPSFLLMLFLCVYKRVWETGVPPLKTLSVRVEIRSTTP